LIPEPISLTSDSTCGYPSAVGYVFSAGSSEYLSIRSVTCAEGYTGFASSVTCQLTGAWTLPSGCTVVGCGYPTHTGYVFAQGSSAGGTVLTSTCAPGYFGTGSSITCQSSSSWTVATGCTIISCPTPVAQTGYVLGSGNMTYGSLFSMTCAVGYSGVATSILCHSSGDWFASEGCYIVDCGDPAVSAAYTVDTGCTTYGCALHVHCAVGYSGSESYISCLSDGTWQQASGCSPISCASSPAFSGYVIAAGSSIYASTRTSTCAIGYQGTGTNITCQFSGSWTSPAGCTLLQCGEPTTQTGYVIESGSYDYASSLAVSCVTGYSGTASSIVCQS